MSNFILFLKTRPSKASVFSWIYVKTHMYGHSYIFVISFCPCLIIQIFPFFGN